MKLEDEGSIPQGELDNVRTVTFLPGVESRFRFGVESSDARHHDLPASLLDRLSRFGDVNAFQGKSLERLKQSGFRFRGGNESHLLMLAGAAFLCRGIRAETAKGYHVFNNWTRMPSALAGSDTADFIVARMLLKSGRSYEEAVTKFYPYKEIQEIRRGEADEFLERAFLLSKRGYINSRLEGFATGTIAEIIRRTKNQERGGISIWGRWLVSGSGRR